MKHLFFSFILLFMSCTSQNKDVPSFIEHKIDTLFITYFQHSVDSDVAITCENILSIQKEHSKNDYDLYFEYGIVPLVIDTFIIDSLYFKKIDSLIILKEETEAFNDDKRMFVSIKRYNKTIDELCIGLSSPKVYYNNKPYILNEELLLLLRYISGYYRWNDPSMFKELDCQVDIKREIEKQYIEDNEFRKKKDNIFLNQSNE